MVREFERILSCFFATILPLTKKPLFNSTFCDLRTKFHFPVRLTLNYGEWIPAAEMAAAAAAAMKTN